MATEPEDQSLGPTHRRVLKMLAKAPRGRDVSALPSRGFRFETIADLVRSGLAAVRVETAKECDLSIEVARLRITDAGRRALGGDPSQRSKERRIKRRTTMK